MSRIPRVTGSDLLAPLSTAGFVVIPLKGSHHFVRHEEGRTTVVPSHAGETIGPGLLHKPWRDCRLKVEDLQELL
jgi:predicted RNA binding protein YcfA (HicA-like mRNA interferase family)